MRVNIDKVLVEKIRSIEVSKSSQLRVQQDKIALVYSWIGHEPTRVSSKIVQHYCGSRNNVLKWLQEEELVLMDRNYSTTARRCKEYRRVINSQVVEWIITTPKILDKMTKWRDNYRKNKVEAVRDVSHKGLTHLIESLSNVEPNLDLYLEAAANKKLQWLREDNVHWELTLSGRISHQVGRLSQEHRSQLLIDGEAVAEVDISASHLCNLAAHFGTPSEASRLFEMVKAGSFYDQFIDEFKKDTEYVTAYNSKNTEGGKSIESPKQWVIRAINNFPDEKLAVYRKLQYMFPETMRRSSSYRYKCGKDGNSKFAVKMQHFEARVIADVATMCKDAGFSCVSVFDSVIVPDSQAHKTLAIIEEVMFRNWGFTGSAKIKSYSLEELKWGVSESSLMTA